MYAWAYSLRKIITSINLVTTTVNHYSYLHSVIGLVFLCRLQVVLNKEDDIREICNYHIKSLKNICKPKKHHREENSIGVRDDGNISICQIIRAANVVYIH